ncbi:MAG: hypothetical protein AAB460_01505 [Patescibacteria group bacterium]
MKKTHLLPTDWNKDEDYALDLNGGVFVCRIQEVHFDQAHCRVGVVVGNQIDFSGPEATNPRHGETLELEHPFSLKSFAFLGWRVRRLAPHERARALGEAKFHQGA